MSNEKLAVLVSGGLDSYVAYRIGQKRGYDPKAFYVDLGHPYAWKEKKAIEVLKLNPETATIDLLRKDLNNMPDEENIWIPGRNLLLATIVASRGYNRIWISALKGEMHEQATDKNNKFFSLATECLSYVYGKFWEETIITTPFVHMSKLDLVKYALTNGITEEELLKTSSCMSGEEGNCGNCMVCVRRHGIFTQLGFDEEYNCDPKTSPNGAKYLTAIRWARNLHDYSHYDLDRIKEVENLL